MIFSNKITRKRLTRQTYAAKNVRLLRRNLEDIRRMHTEIPEESKEASEVSEFITELEGQIREAEKLLPISQTELEAFLEQIPDRTSREAARLHFGEGMGYREIGEQMGCGWESLKERTQVAVRKIVEPEIERPLEGLSDFT